jgi:hypothetical protein
VEEEADLVDDGATVVTLDQLGDFEKVHSPGYFRGVKRWR